MWVQKRLRRGDRQLLENEWGVSYAGRTKAVGAENIDRSIYVSV